jgi:hypothetical protein
MTGGGLRALNPFAYFDRRRREAQSNLFERVRTMHLEARHHLIASPLSREEALQELGASADDRVTREELIDHLAYQRTVERELQDDLNRRRDIRQALSVWAVVLSVVFALYWLSRGGFSRR